MRGNGGRRPFYRACTFWMMIFLLVVLLAMEFFSGDAEDEEEAEVSAEAEQELVLENLPESIVTEISEEKAGTAGAVQEMVLGSLPESAAAEISEEKEEASVGPDLAESPAVTAEFVGNEFFAEESSSDEILTEKLAFPVLISY